jgi:hypothetical protein
MSTTFADIQQILDAISNKNGKINFAPHGTFWRQTGNYDSDYVAFTTGRVPGLVLPILNPTDPANSAFLLVLTKPNAVPGVLQMPGGGPFITQADYAVTLFNGQTITGQEIKTTILSWLSNGFPR